jgi:hypothetical protein
MAQKYVEVFATDIHSLEKVADDNGIANTVLILSTIVTERLAAYRRDYPSDTAGARMYERAVQELKACAVTISDKIGLRV